MEYTKFSAIQIEAGDMDLSDTVKASDYALIRDYIMNKEV